MPMKKDSRKIKILFLIDELRPGGTEKQMLLLTESLPRQQFAPIIGVLRNTDFLAALKIDTPIINFCRSAPPFVRNFSTCLRLSNFIDRERIDILQTQFPESFLYATAAKLISEYRPVLVSTRRNLYHWVAEEPMLFQGMRLCSRWADYVLVNSHNLLEECQRRENIPSRKIVYIPNGVEIEKFGSLSSIEARNKIGLNRNAPVIGVVANWRPIKGLDIFLRAAAKVHRELPDAYFVLAGHGPLKDELSFLAQDLGISERVILIENSPDIPAVMSAFDVAVQSSLSESFSNVLLEYMASSKPIVATRVGEADRLIENGKDGLLIQPGNADELSSSIIWLCHNRQRARSFAQAARQKVNANWASNRIVMHYCLFYDGIRATQRETN